MKKIVLFFSFCLLAIAAKAQISTSPSSLCFTTPPGTTSDTQVVYVTVNIPSITPSRHLTITAPNAYMVSFDGVSWASSISTSALLADVTLNIPVYVNFHPTDSNSYPEGLLLSVEGIPIVDYPLCGNGSGPTISRFTADSFVVFIDEFCAGPQVTIAKNSYVAGQSVKTYFGDNKHAKKYHFQISFQNYYQQHHHLE